MNVLNLAGVGGYDPPHDGIKNRCLTNLAIPHLILERIERIELSYLTWKDSVLTIEPYPLSLILEESIGFEPINLGFAIQCLNHLANFPLF